MRALLASTLLIGLAAAMPIPGLSAAQAGEDALPGLSMPDKPVFFLTGYLWTSAMNGQVGTLPRLLPANVNLSFGDILQNFDGGIMGGGEMRLRHWSVLLDTMWMQISPDATLSGPLQTQVNLRSRSLALQSDVLYRIYNSRPISVDAGLGFRYWHLDNQLTIDPNLGGDGGSTTQTEDWVDPLFVTRLSTRLGGPWSLTFIGDVGGFNMGSQLTYQLAGTLNYQLNSNLALRAAYRLLSVDYEQGNYLYNVTMQGPIIGMTYRF